MNLDNLIKYLIWIVFFGVVLTALYFLLQKGGLI